MRFYITFGVQYRYAPHPRLAPEVAHPDGVMEIIAPDEEVARALAHAVTGGGYAFIYPWGDGPDPKYHPRGATSTLAFTRN